MAGVGMKEYKTYPITIKWKETPAGRLYFINGV